MRLHLFPYRDGRISIPLSSSCSGKVDESSLYISPYELNANSISDIKTFKSSYQFSSHRRVKEANPGSLTMAPNCCPRGQDGDSGISDGKCLSYRYAQLFEQGVHPLVSVSLYTFLFLRVLYLLKVCN